jgi:hypothetical protein
MIGAGLLTAAIAFGQGEVVPSLLGLCGAGKFARGAMRAVSVELKPQAEPAK